MPGTDRQPSSLSTFSSLAQTISGLISTSGSLRSSETSITTSALVHVDLGRRQADAVGVVHGLEHVGDQRLDAGVDALHRLGHRVQARVRVTQEWFVWP